MSNTKTSPEMEDYTQAAHSDKQQLLVELVEAVDNLKLVIEGKMKARPIDELIDEL